MVAIRQEIISEVGKLTEKVGQILLKNFNLPEKNQVKFKSRHEIVTSADLLAEKIILKKLNALTPDFRIISEEAGDNEKKSDYLWTVDPLDGTTNFYMGNPLFAVQISLLYKNEPILSFIYAPFLKEFYFAQKGKGAFLNGKKIQVSKKNRQSALLTYCHGETKKNLEQTIKIYAHYKNTGFDIRQIGSAALEFAWVAAGKTECYISPSTRLWDIAPGALLVKEAGGTVSNFQGKPWQAFQAKNVFAGNGLVDKDILNFLKKL